jgi:hypothetical protein
MLTLLKHGTGSRWIKQCPTGEGKLQILQTHNGPTSTAQDFASHSQQIVSHGFTIMFQLILNNWVQHPEPRDTLHKEVNAYCHVVVLGKALRTSLGRREILSRFGSEIVLNCLLHHFTSWQHCQNTLNPIRIPFPEWIFSTLLHAFALWKPCLEHFGQWSLALETRLQNIVFVEGILKGCWQVFMPQKVQNGWISMNIVSVKNVKSLNLRRLERKPVHFCRLKMASCCL